MRALLSVTALQQELNRQNATAAITPPIQEKCLLGTREGVIRQTIDWDKSRVQAALRTI
jgi:hypothetical protein